MLILRRSFFSLINHCRFCSTIDTVKSWQIDKYGGPEQLKLNISAKLPVILRPNDVLIQVHAASVNPIDVKMLGGFGSQTIGVMRQVVDCSNKSEFPLTLGRDFSGVVVDTGQGVKSFKPGDEVWGAIGPERSGSHAEYVVADSCSIALKPVSLNHIEAASIPYVAMTAWSALCLFGRLSERNARNCRVLIFGGSGGLGMFSIQLLKAWGAEITATCSTDAVEVLQSIGADYVLDYKFQDIKAELRQMERFDLILDGVGGATSSFALDLLKPWNNSKYITLVSPLLDYTDHYGMVFGLLYSGAEAVQDTVRSGLNGRSIRWAYFYPNGAALKIIKTMMEKGKITPTIEQTFTFDKIPEAYKKLSEGHARGKTVIQVV